MSNDAKKAAIVILLGLSIYQNILVRRLSRKLVYGRQQFHKLQEISSYLLEVINNNDIKLTEFDLIAITAINEEGK